MPDTFSVSVFCSPSRGALTILLDGSAVLVLVVGSSDCQRSVHTNKTNDFILKPAEISAKLIFVFEKTAETLAKPLVLR